MLIASATPAVVIYVAPVSPLETMAHATVPSGIHVPVSMLPSSRCGGGVERRLFYYITGETRAWQELRKTGLQCSCDTLCMTAPPVFGTVTLGAE